MAKLFRQLGVLQMTALRQRVQSPERGFVNVYRFPFGIPDFVTARSAALKVMYGTVAFYNPLWLQTGLLKVTIAVGREGVNIRAFASNLS
jgi:hypothetical protein